MSNDDELKFKVSTGLKNIIGKDLISDKYIAIFELVKNSYDAGAKDVKISFIKSNLGELEIQISDDGHGMNKDDILNKWLFVAYSDKNPENKRSKSYIDDIKRVAAGAKGVGRFSCDRLGTVTHLITKVSDESIAHVIDVNWGDFEHNDSREFKDVNVHYSQIQKLPTGNNSGTTLIINELREEWKRNDMLKLKRSLMRLISPDVDSGDLSFKISIYAPDEKTEDDNLKNKPKYFERDIVNGEIKNDVFEKLNLKTTQIKISIPEDNRKFETTLIDRGELIFKIIENNIDYPLLKNIKISLFYLNQPSKKNFTEIMGVEPVNYGSVFIYKNGFRVNPYGEKGEDFFGVDHRKPQGYNRFLGTREILGRININGNNDGFIETTSRAHGFINTPSVDMLVDFFIQKVLKTLERYVTNIISWGAPIKKEGDRIIQPSDLSEGIINHFLGLDKNKNNIVSVEFNSNLLNKKLNDDDINSNIDKIQKSIDKNKDKELSSAVKNLKKKTETLVSKNTQLEKENISNKIALNEYKKENEVRRGQTEFLETLSDKKSEELLEIMHQIYPLVDVIGNKINRLQDIISNIDDKNNLEILQILSVLSRSNMKIKKYIDHSIDKNQTENSKGRYDIGKYIKKHVDNKLMLDGLNYNLSQNNDESYICSFDPMSIDVILDNIASNSKKAHADTLDISFKNTDKTVEITFKDNGVGLDPNIDPNLLFKLGITTTNLQNGHGIGLYNIKHIVEKEHNGSVKIDSACKNGFCLVVSFNK